MSIIKIKDARDTVASMYWDLKKDHKTIDDFSNISYDVGYMVGILIHINKKKLADKIYNEFLGNW